MRWGGEGDEGFFSFVREVVEAGQLRREASFIQHGETSTLVHSLAVAYRADAIGRARGLFDLLPEIRRAALLHDYYLYDWHDPDPAHRLHGFRHPRFALLNAARDYADLTAREADAILRHMFPLTPTPPRSRVGWAVTLADKLCASVETGVRTGCAYPELCALCARFLPDVELSLPREAPRPGAGVHADVPPAGTAGGPGCGAQR